jgi:hypothetical protein
MESLIERDRSSGGRRHQAAELDDGRPASVRYRQRTAMDAIVQELRRTIETSGVCYAALLDDQIVLRPSCETEGR